MDDLIDSEFCFSFEFCDFECLLMFFGNWWFMIHHGLLTVCWLSSRDPS